MTSQPLQPEQLRAMPLSDAELEEIRSTLRRSPGMFTISEHRLLATISSDRAALAAVLKLADEHATARHMEATPYCTTCRFIRDLRRRSALNAPSEAQQHEVTPLHQAWEGTAACLWCGLQERFWTAMQRCVGHRYGDPLPASEAQASTIRREIEHLQRLVELFDPSLLAQTLRTAIVLMQGLEFSPDGEAALAETISRVGNALREPSEAQAAPVVSDAQVATIADALTQYGYGSVSDADVRRALAEAALLAIQGGDR